MSKFVTPLKNGIIKENPTFVLMLGMCPTLAVTTSAISGVSMGLSTMAVLVMSNLFISLLRKVIPDQVRIPAYIVIIASFVTMVKLIIEAYAPSVYEALGVYIPLIVVNCIILGRAEAFASKNGVLDSVGDGFGMGLGFTLSLTVIGLLREIIGAGTAFGWEIPIGYEPVGIFVMAPGALLLMGFLQALMNKLKAPGAKRREEFADCLSCGGNCATCIGHVHEENQGRVLKEAQEKKEAEKAAKAAAKAQKGGNEA